MACIWSLILKDAECLWQLISSMTFGSAGPLGNGKGCFTLIFSQLAVHASNQWHRKINRESIVKSTKYFTTAKVSLIRRLSDAFPERNEMREPGMCHRRISYVCTSWRFIVRDFILIKQNLKCFGITAVLKCTLFLVLLLIYLQVALSNLIFSPPSETMDSFWP